MEADDATPGIATIGVDGMLVRFADRLTEPANRAALTFCAALRREAWDGIEEVSSSLVSTYLRFDPLHLRHDTLRARVQRLLDRQDWYAADLPAGRRLWRVPAVFDADHGPQLGDAARAAGMDEAEAIASLTGARLRVQTIGFAPGQPYLGALPEAWNIPRQSTLTKRIPEGAVAVAIRQLVLFSRPTPTGWQHVGQTAMRLFQPEAQEPFLLRPGDEVQFTQVDAPRLEAMKSDRMGGATCEPLA